MRDVRVPALMWITDGKGSVDRILSIAEQSVSGGVDAIQIREPGIDHAALSTLIALLAANVAGRAGVFVNGELEIARTCGVGLHLPQRRDLGAARQALGPEVAVGRSVHDPSTAVSSQDADFVIAGHVFATPSHANLSPIGIRGLEAIIGVSPRPVLGIGGIDEHSAGAVMAAGAAGVAVISAIGSSPDPEGAARRIAAAIAEATKCR